MHGTSTQATNHLGVLLRKVQRRLQASLALALVCAGVAHVFYHVTYTLDDAYITFRYSRNLAHGLGLVYNPGEYVKGYSNTLVTLLSALPELVGHDAKWLIKSLSLAAYIALLLCGARLHNPVGRDRGVWFIALCACSPALCVHFVNGLETGTHTFLVFAAVMRRVYEQDTGVRPYSAVLFSLVVLSRPEAIAIFAAVAAFDMAWRLYVRRFTRADLWFYLLPTTAYCAELALSAWYYGHALPQTYYAKADPVSSVGDALETMKRGLFEQVGPKGYLRRGLEREGFGLLGLLFVPLALLGRARRRRNFVFALALFAQLVFIVRADSDWAPAFRFGVPLLPFLFALTTEAIATMSRLAGKYQRILAWTLIATWLIYHLPDQLHESASIQAVSYVNAENKLNEGEFLATLAPPGITMASSDIGGHGYSAAAYNILDAGGLTSPEANCRIRRCRRYTSLVLPELIRVHNRRERDAFVFQPALQHHAYAKLDGGKYLLRRELLFTREPLAPLQPSAAEPEHPPSAHDLPEAVRVGRATQLVIYWPRSQNAFQELAARHLEWLGAGGHYDARASASILQHLKPRDWRAGESFADRITIFAPQRPGSYQLQVVAGNKRTSLGSIDIVSESDSPARAQSLATRAEALMARGEPAGLQLYETAVQLSNVARQAYLRHTRDEARKQRKKAEQIAVEDPERAFQLVQNARAGLTRAYWYSQQATATLRSELRALGLLRAQLLERLVGAP